MIGSDGGGFLLSVDSQVNQVAVGFVDEFSGDEISSPRFDRRTGFDRKHFGGAFGPEHGYAGGIKIVDETIRDWKA